MLTLDLSSFLIQLKEGSINNVGAPTKSASVKMYDVTEVEARAFGDGRVKFVCADDEGNAIEVALFPEHIEALEDDLAAVKASGTVEGLDEE